MTARSSTHDEALRLSIVRVRHGESERILITNESRQKYLLRQTVTRLGQVLKSRSSHRVGFDEMRHTHIGKSLLKSILLDRCELTSTSHRIYHPYFQVFLSLLHDYKDYIAVQPRGDQWLDRFVSDFRDRCAVPELRRIVQNAERCARSNTSTAKALLADVRNGCSKVLALRVDLEYPVRLAPTLQPGILSEAVMRSHRTALLRDLREGPYSKHLVGYIWTTEYGEIRGYHHHLLLLMDGQRVCQDITIAAAICGRWRHIITEGMGTSHNCNMDKARYARCGIGMINRRNDIKWDHLEEATLYLAKADFYMRQVIKGRGRFFGTGGFYKPGT